MNETKELSGTRQLDQEAIEQLFLDLDHQVDVALAIYKMAFPNWDDIVSIDGWPSINKKTANALMQHFISFDRRHHPEVFSGGLWMNKGFSQAEEPNDLNDYEIDLDGVTIELQ